MSDPWYKKGLRFGCTGCGKCCTGEPGYVWVSDEEIEIMARALSISPEEFTRLYVRKVGNRLSLKESSKTYDCVFLKEKKYCALYQARPKQCKTFPFWKENLESKEAWEETKERCEGIDHPDAPLISLEEIQNSFAK